jgi:hypothetical protein
MMTIIAADNGTKIKEDRGQHDDKHDVHRECHAVDGIARYARKDTPRLVDGAVDHRQAGGGQDQRGGAARGVGCTGDGRCRNQPASAPARH